MGSQQIHIHLSGSGNSDIVKYLTFTQRVRLTDARLVSNGSLTAHDTNFCAITVYGKGGSQEALKAETKATGGTGDLTAGTVKSLTAIAAGADKLVFEAGDSIKLASIDNGSSPAIDVNLIVGYVPANLI